MGRVDIVDIEGRLTVAVEHINVFGFIPTVDLIAAKSRDAMVTEDLKSELCKLYEQLQGEEVREIALELSEVYEKVDFGEYELNQGDLTKREIGRINQAVKVYDNPRVLDLGAGVGRHAIGMSKKFENFVALEYEAKHVAKIKSQEPEIEVVQGDWMELRKLVPERDFIYSLGRTIAHNRTPSDMFAMFGEVEGVLSENGRFMFDLPDVDWGIYEDRIGRLRENLKTLGVEPYQSEVIFDGPDDVNRFNRMIWRPEQIMATAKLLGFKVLVEFEGTQINLESQGMSRRDHEAAMEARTRLG